jgi:hypothetical protein
MDYLTVVGPRNLAALEWEFRDNPFGDTLWILNETEHGSNGPERLFAFADLLRNPGRTAEIDAQFLVPWLVRYMWEVPHPRYTAAAWPVLMEVAGQDADLVGLAVEILTQHPHGSLRAAVLEPTDDYTPAHLDAPELIALLPDLIAHDPDPDVRLAAIKHASYLGYFDPKVLNLFALFHASAENDPSPHVRGQALALLWELRDGAEWDRGFLVAQLMRADNRSVLPVIMPGVLRTVGYGKPADAELIAAAFNVLARERVNPRYDDIVNGLGWATLALSRDGRPGMERWLGAAPFADGTALLAFLQGQFENPDISAEDRVLAVTVLHRLGKMPPAQAILDLLLADDTGPLAMSLAGEVGWPLMPLMRAKTATGETGLAVLQALYTNALRGGPDEVSQMSIFRKRIVEMVVKRAISLARSGSAADLDTAFDWILTDPDDQSFALYDLRNTDAILDQSRLADVALNAANSFAQAGVAETIAIRYQTLGDAAMLPLLERVLSETQSANVLGSIARELPPRSTLATDRPADEKRLVAAMVAGLDRTKADEDYSYMRDAANNWLGQSAKL